MSLQLTPHVDANRVRPPLVVIQVTDEPAETMVTVERSLDGRIWQPVRGGLGTPMPTGGALILQDWAAPTGVRVWYRVTVDGVSQMPVETMISLPDGQIWIQDAFSPQNGIPTQADVLDAGASTFDANSFRSASWPQPFDEVQVLGASLPVESVGMRSRVGNVPIIIHALIAADADLLRALLLESGVLLIRGMNCELLPPSAFVALPDVVEVHRGNPHEVASFAANARLTREPSPLIAIAFWTWAQVNELVWQRLGLEATYGDVQAATLPATYDEILADPTLLAAVRTRPKG